MKPLSAFLVLLLLISNGYSATASAQNAGAAQYSAADGESVLALQVAELASSTKLTPQAKQKRIADLVRKTVLAATANAKDPEQAVQIAVGLATAAAQAVPEYSQFVINAVVSIPSIASVDGAMDAVRSAVVGAASPDTQQTRSNAGPADSRAPAAPSSGNGGGGVVVASPSH
jgi:hypothetical protein